MGSTEVAVSDGLAGVSCASSGDVRACRVGDELPGRTVTLPRRRDGRVARMLIGIVIA